MTSDPAEQNVRPFSDLTIDSAQLFGSRKTVLIRHQGQVYRLMITKQNKLILTK